MRTKTTCEKAITKRTYRKHKKHALKDTVLPYGFDLGVLLAAIKKKGVRQTQRYGYLRGSIPTTVVNETPPFLKDVVYLVFVAVASAYAKTSGS